MNEKNSRPKLMKTLADIEELKGRYANIVNVTIQERDVVLDFAHIIATNDEKSTQLISRVFLNHFTAREIADVIQVGLQKWEENRFENPKKYLP